MPTVWSTVYMAFVEETQLRPGQRVLIHAATGGVGLVAVDFADNTYTIVQGDEERYDRELIKRLRVPMITWMQAESSIEEQEEVGEEIYRRR